MRLRKLPLSATTLLFCALLLVSCTKNDKGFMGSGTFEAEDVTVSAELGGKLLTVTLEEGAQVDSGTLAMVIDTLQLDLKRKLLATSRTGTAAKRPDASSQIAVIEKQIATAKVEKARVTSLIAAKAAPQKQLDDINGLIELYQKQLASLKSTLAKSSTGVDAELSSLDIQLAQLEDQINRSKVVTPLKGTILRTYARAGEFVTPGKPLFSMAALDTLTLRAYLSAPQLEKLKLGQAMLVETDGEGKKGRQFEGKLLWISDKAEFTPKTVLTKDERANLVYAVKVAVKNDGTLRIGMYGSLKEKNEP